MSYEKIKSMSVKELPNGNINVKICAACNNIHPLYYVDSNVETTWERLFMYLNGGNWQPNESANNGLWSALTYLIKNVAEKDGYDSYKLYQMSYKEENKEENQLIIDKYVNLFKVYYVTLRNVPKHYVAVMGDNGCIHKMSTSKIWTNKHVIRKHPLLKCIIMYFRAKNDFGNKNVNIVHNSDLGFYTNSLVELVNTL